MCAVAHARPVFQAARLCKQLQRGAASTLRLPRPSRAPGETAGPKLRGPGPPQDPQAPPLTRQGGTRSPLRTQPSQQKPCSALTFKQMPLLVALLIL